MQLSDIIREIVFFENQLADLKRNFPLPPLENATILCSRPYTYSRRKDAQTQRQKYKKAVDDMNQLLKTIHKLNNWRKQHEPMIINI
ncbi:MAG: hypothetical protein KUG81_04040 [Gammaproteobacteria bacterium]|nr:hypothetical protein [Gammaproteobacteria bacterium]